MAVAIVLAAGSGKRMNSDVAKQFLTLNGKEVLYYALNTFENSEEISHIILVTKEEDIEYCQNNIVNKYGFNKVYSVIAGGKERYDSVYCGLRAISKLPANERQIVMIHDGARPFVTERMIVESVQSIKDGNKSCTVAVPVKDTIARAKQVSGKLHGTGRLDRNELYQIQTPQTFDYKILYQAYEKMNEKTDGNHNITDDTSVAELYADVHTIFVMGDYKNIKITTPEDLEIGEIFAKKSF